MKWDNISLGEVIDVKHGYPFKSEFFSDTGDLILLSPGNCHEAGGLKLKGDKEKYYIGEYPEEYLLNEGEIIVVMTDLINTAPILGGAFLIPESNRFLHNQRLGLVQVTNEKRIDRRFLLYLLNSPEYRGQIRGSASGATVRHTAPNRIKECRLRIPKDISYQKKVGNLLSAYDDLIDNNRRRMSLLEDSARHLYREWFVRLRFPGHEHTPIVDGVPQGWERRTAFDSMQVLSGGTPKTSISDYWDGETPFFTPKDAVDGIWVSSCERSLTELGIKNCNSKLYPRETVFITARGTVGKLNMAQTPMAMSQSCYALVAKDHLSQRFIYSAMREGVEALRQQAVGAVFDAIVVDTFKRIHLTIPTATVLRLFDEAVEPVFAQVENLASQNQKLRQARDLLLPRLMNGGLAV